MSDIGARFKRDTADHEMTVLHDDGLYRHVRFQRRVQRQDGSSSLTSIYWFELITVPGSLIFRGDGDSFVFARLTDMFEFFRDSGYQGRPNVQYWAEKLTAGGPVMKYDRELLAAQVKEDAANYHEGAAVLDRLMVAVQDEILDELIGDESIDHKRVSDFSFYENPDDRWKVPHKDPDFQFYDTYEWKCRDYDWWYLWACHGILWGISQYDALKTGPSAVAS